MQTTLRESLSTAFVLLLFSVVCASLLAGAYLATRPNIERSEQAQKLALLVQTLPAHSFDNDPVNTTHPLPMDPLLGLKHAGTAYLATQAGAPVAVVLEAVAPDGYAGEIGLLIGIRADGRIAGVRVTHHRETPGLGDYIEIAKNDWIAQFIDKRLDAPVAAAWKVRKDGGRFDYLSGATVTPRAIVKAVHKALRYFELHRGELLSRKRMVAPSFLDPHGGRVGRSTALGTIETSLQTPLHTVTFPASAN